MSQPLIDLGEIRADPVPGPVARRYPRTWVFVAALCGVLLVGGAVGPNLALVQVRALNYRNGQTFQLTADRLYVVDRGGARGARLIAYAVPTVRGLWSITLRWQPNRLIPARPAGVLLAVAPDVSASVTAVDLATGQVRWHLDDRLLAMAPDKTTAVLATARPGPAASGGGFQVMAVDLATGRARWSYAWDGGSRVRLDATFAVAAVDATGRWVVAVRRLDGSTQLRDGYTGQVLATGRLPAPPVDSPSNPGVPVLAAAGGVLEVRYRELDETVLDGYDLRTLARRWSRLLAGDAPYLDPCGGAICAGGAQAGISAIDPRTGRVLWTDALRSRVVPLPPGRTGARLLAFQPPMVSELTARHVAILDAGTGRRVEELGDWWWPASGPDGGRLLLARPNQTITSVFAVLDLPTLAQRQLGALPVWPFDCQAAGDHLACPSFDGLLRIWRYRT